MANATWYTIRAYDLNGESVQFSSPRKVEIKRVLARWEAQGYTGAHYR
jgi:hypothetical protein